jgi:hypothetical protein
VRATVLTGISFASSAAVVAGDSILVAIGKLQAQLNLRPISWALATNTNTTTNLNLGTNFSTTAPIVGTFTNDASGDFTQSGSTGVTCNFTGEIEISASFHYFGFATRANVRMRAKLAGTQFGPIGASGYIRNATGHNESSCHITTTRVSVTTGQTITIGTDREGGSGTIEFDTSGTSNMYIKRVG